ncbi:MAG: hypothetical protein ACK5NT_15175 [Pyrinomonadaceae bacterium]
MIEKLSKFLSEPDILKNPSFKNELLYLTRVAPNELAPMRMRKENHIYKSRVKHFPAE